MAERYKAKHGKTSPGKIVAWILIPILIVALLGGGGFALWHFVFNAPQKQEETLEVAPTVETEATLAPAPTHAPTEAPEPDYDAAADAYIKKMTLREKIYQMMIVSPAELTGVDGATEAGDTTKQMIEEHPVGGIIYFSDNFESKDQVKKLISGTQSFAKTPMFISVDEEGGEVSRVADAIEGIDKLNAMFTYKSDGETKASANALTIADYLTPLGFNLNFAPVADVWSDAENTVIGDRAYSDNYEEAAKLVSAAVTGFEDGGVLTAAKHFPGHGTASGDTHDGAATVSKTKDELIKEDLLPFKSAIDADVDMIMVGHLTVTDMDAEYPATLSSVVVPELLRKELGYDGIAITDSMEMGAVYGYSNEQIASGIFSADIDMILMPADMEGFVSAVEAMLENGEIKSADIDKRVRKIIALKYEKGIMEMPSENASEPAETTAASESASEAASEDASLPEESSAPAA